MTEEVRARRNFVKERLGEISGWRYDVASDLRKSLKAAEPQGVKTARKIAKQFDATVERKCSSAKKRHEKQLAPIREAIAFGRYDDALRMIKRVKK